MRAVGKPGSVTANGELITEAGAGGRLPPEWEAVAPNAVLSPVFGSDVDVAGSPRLWGRGNGRAECFGFLRRRVHLDAGKWYELRVTLQAEDLTDLNRHLVHALFACPPRDFNAGVLDYRQGDGVIHGEASFRGPNAATEAEVRLEFRFSPHGRVSWSSVVLEERAPLPPRPARIACSWGSRDLAHWSRLLDDAGRRGVDIVLLPEMFAGTDPCAAQPLDGPAAALLAAKASQWHMYVSGAMYERRGDTVFNTAPLYDRGGTLLGSYSKNELYDRELDQGVTPGRGYPVFKADFGSIGIIICYDSWFPETVRLLAYRGAELVLFPNAGYFAGLMPARAADNGVWLAVSSIHDPAGLWDPSGAQAGEKTPDPTRHSASSVRSYERDARQGLVVVGVDMSERFSPHWWGGPMLSAPAARRVRQTLLEPIEPEIAREATRWSTA